MRSVNRHKFLKTRFGHSISSDLQALLEQVVRAIKSKSALRTCFFDGCNVKIWVWLARTSGEVARKVILNCITNRYERRQMLFGLRLAP